MADPLPLPLTIYRRLATALAPLAPLLLRRRVRSGKEDPDRLGERLGIAGRPRPAGRLIWLHGASVGETMSCLPLIEALTERGALVLVTSGTVTSARLMAERLPANAVHQFLPLDVPAYVRRFLAHWQPDCALFAESEIWPNLILESHARGLPVMIINGRMSERSFRRWQKRPATIRALLGRIDVCMAQSSADAFRYGALGAQNVKMPGNLKFDGPVLPAAPAALAALEGAIAGRPLWLAASTHAGEEAAVLGAHRAVAAAVPSLLTIIVPRHPERGVDLAAAAQARGLTVARRGAGTALAADTAIYIADTIGELGLFYRLAPLVFMGGSFIPHGGQNPIEPAKLGAAVLHGPHVFNFVEAFGVLERAGAAAPVADGDELARRVLDMLMAPDATRAMGRRARQAMQDMAGATQRTLQLIGHGLDQRSRMRDEHRERA